MRQLPSAPVFSRRDTRALGWSDPAHSRAVRSGQLARLRRDQFTALPVDARIAAIAAARGCSGSVISHRSAAVLHGLPIVGTMPAVPDVTVQPRRTGDLHGAHLYRATMRPEDVVEVDGLPVTSVARTVIDLGRHRPAATMVSAADFALHHALTSLDELREVLDSCRGWPRVDRAARALAMVDARAESPLESISRLALRWLHLPTPDLQSRIHGRWGEFVARTDFYWDQFGVVGEADGRATLADAADLYADKQRQEALERLGIYVVRWNWTDVIRWPRLLGARVHRQFDLGRRRDQLGFPRQWSVAG